MRTDRYLKLLKEIRTHLATFGNTRWPPRLDDWIREFDVSQHDSAQRVAHLQRTRRALGGMGSIADVVIRPDATRSIDNDDRTIKKANETLLRLVAQLDKEVDNLLRSERVN